MQGRKDYEDKQNRIFPRMVNDRTEGNFWFCLCEQRFVSPRFDLLECWTVKHVKPNLSLPFFLFEPGKPEHLEVYASLLGPPFPPADSICLRLCRQSAAGCPCQEFGQPAKGSGPRCAHEERVGVWNISYNSYTFLHNTLDILKQLNIELL